MLHTWLHVTPHVAHHSTNSIKYVQRFNKLQGITIKPQHHMLFRYWLDNWLSWLKFYMTGHQNGPKTQPH